MGINEFMRVRRPYVVLVESDEEHSLIESGYLSESGCDVARVGGAAEALRSIEERPPALVVAEVLLRGMSGFELCARLRGDGATRDIPIMLLSSLFVERTTPPSVVLGETVINAKADTVLARPVLKGEFVDHALALLGDEDADARLADSRRSRVLVIDDDPGTLRLLQRVLAKKSSYIVLSAASGNEGLEVFRREEPDVVVLDVRLPDISGLDVCGIMKEERAVTSVVLITAFGSELIAVEAMRKNADDYLSKPLNLAETIAVVDENLRKSLICGERERLLRQLTWMNKDIFARYELLQKTQDELMALKKAGRQAA